jgi:trehalose utilization protein
LAKLFIFMKKLHLSLLIVISILVSSLVAEPAKVVFISGKPSHGPKMHEHRAGNMLLAKALNESGLDVETVVLEQNGYPQNVGILDGASTVVLFCTGHKGHLLNPHLETFDALMDKGVGVVMIHWATEAMKGEAGEKFLSWMGGFCDLDWSVNPHWTPHFSNFPDHPIANGVKPFSLNDEWYYHMRFVDGMKGVTSILADLPLPETLSRADGPRWGNPDVRASVAAGEKQTVGWAYQRPGGGRGFGFTGGHYHKSWQNDEFRKVVLNAILWTAQVEVPKKGLESKRPTDEEMLQNLDLKEKKK